MNHILLVFTTFILIASEIGLFQRWFARYLPLIGPQSALVTLGLIQVYLLKHKLIQIIFTSYLLSDHHFLVHEDTPPYIEKLLLAAGIISGISGFFNIVAVSKPPDCSNVQSVFFRGSTAGRMRTIRRHGTPVPDSERGSISDKSYQDDTSNSTSAFATFKGAFSKADKENSPRQLNISRPYPAYSGGN